MRSALHVLARNGIDALSMRTVARHAGCTIGLINHWFSSKEDLITAAWEESKSQTGRSTVRAQKKGISLEFLMQVLPTNAAKSLDQKIWLAFTAMAIGNKKLAAANALTYTVGRRQLAAMLIEAGHPPSGAIEAAGTIIAALDGIIYDAGIEPDYWTPSRQRRALRTLISGFFRKLPQ
ncbi:MAG: TetR/AcrR family transcriptional regulator [Proteobacteria bacterium]|nr:TetR/AcrR family transcriptional regulator [Pseudomonadota bacterium]